jgi:serine/threonine-protein kinase HSL1 (negative regulator of Swe1 kinase)
MPLLTCFRINQEKYFYAALLEYRRQHLESYDYNSYRNDRLGQSSSDHQHLTQPMRQLQITNLSRYRTANAYGQNTPQFSVRGNEHLHSKHSFYEAPVASDHPLQTSNSQGVDVGETPAAQSPYPDPSKVPLRYRSRRARAIAYHQASLGVEPSTGVSLASSRVSTKAPTLSAQKQAGSLTVPGPAARYKRNVSFDHRRRPWNWHSNNSLREDSDLFDGHGSRSRSPTRRSNAPLVSSTPSNNVVRSAKEKTAAAVPGVLGSRNRDIDVEARKVSTELEKACEEAFFRSLITDDLHTSLTELGERRMTVTSTTPAQLSSTITSVNQNIFQNILNRPLPPTPFSSIRANTNEQYPETPGTYTTRELQAMRDRLKSRYVQQGVSTDQQFSDVLRQIDTLLPKVSDTTKPQSTSVPTNGFGLLSEEDLGDSLHVFPTELLGSGTNNGSFASWLRRAVTDPVHRKADSGVENKTIRMVEPSSPASPVSPASPASPAGWAPLNIRKISGSSGKQAEEPKHTYQNNCGHTAGIPVPSGKSKTFPPISSYTLSSFPPTLHFTNRVHKHGATLFEELENAVEPTSRQRQEPS